jgi:hypothetical protein
MRGDAILAIGTTKIPTFLENLARESQQRWTFLSDPCFEKDKNGTVVEKKDC